MRFKRDNAGHYLCRNPILLSFSDDNLHLREIVAHVAGSKHQSHATAVLLRALEREGYLKGR